MGSQNYSKNSDYYLWQRFRKGDKQALTKIYYDNYNLLFNYGLRLYNKPPFIKDCIQELFQNLITKLSSLGSTDNISLYLIASLRRKVFDKLKRNTTYEYSENDETLYDFTIDASPEDKLITEEIEDHHTQKINEMLNALSSREREAIYLKFYRNMSYEEITQVMDINYQSARKLIYRAISTLREKGRKIFNK
jgi:RNA polymerase sigma factor (sigma-70 family)